MILIAGSPANSFTINFPVFLYELIDREFKEGHTLVSLEESTVFIRPYHEHGLILVGSQTADSFLLTVVDTDSVEELVSHEMDFCRNCIFASNSYLLELPGNRLNFAVVILEAIQDLTSLRVHGVDIADGTRTILELGDLKYAVNFGLPGGRVDSPDFLRAIFAAGIKAVYGYTQQLDLNWNLPEGLVLEPENAVIQLVNNSDIRVISSSLAATEGGDSTTLHLYSKPSQEWSSLTLNGNSLRVRGFGEWIAAEEAYRDEIQTGFAGYDVAPGEFLDADERFAYSESRQTGRFYLHNAFSKSTSEHNTGNPDSEVLLIDGDTVYIRVADELIKSQIVAGRIMNQEVILKSPEVLHVHWLALPRRN
ncbi:MAG: hypothetical protein Q8L60_14545 [Gammaproteobacteria bacterium]|nr:hypothetical protein [Gammaproteobacteria bacterium]